MDHLPLPKEPTFPFPRIPFICEHLEDFTDFVSYPVARAAEWQVYLPPRDTAGTWLRQVGLRSPECVDEVEAFLQRWVFFGLIREILLPVNLFDADDYIGTDKDGRYIHTRGLDQRLDKAAEAVKSLSSDRRKEFCERVYDCLTFASDALMSFYYIDQADLIRDYAVKISVLGICETIYDFADLHLPHESRTWSRRGFASVDVSSELVVDRMLANGWCRSEIKVAQDKCLSTAARHFIHRVRKPKLDLDHGRCTDNKCFQTQIVVENYTPKHADDDCTCEFVGPDPAQVAACLENGSFPLLRVSDIDGDLTLSVVPYYADATYVALSHVWADGLGNPSASRLPRCQVIRLRVILENLRSRSFDWGVEGSTDMRTYDGELLLWVDSLCCPTIPQVGATDTDRAHKRMAIDKLRVVYQKATYVLVLDRTLELTSSKHLTSIETAVRLLNSRWIGRLWTFQEAVLPKKLLILSEDEVYDVRELWRELKGQQSRRALNRSLLRDIISQIVYIRAWHTLTDLETLYLSGLMGAVRHRRVTEPSDEAICIAVILELDVSQVSAAENHLRMATVWRLLSATKLGIPPGIIFSTLPRLRTPGFRWAPASFQEPLSGEHQRASMDIDDITRAIWIPEGLLVRRAGVQLQGGIPPRGFEPLISSAPSVIKDYVAVRHANGSWYNIIIQDHLNLDPTQQLYDILQDRSKDWHLILDQRSPTEGNNQTVLVYPERTSQRTVWRTAALLSWNRMDPNNEALKQVADQHSSVLRSHSTVRSLQIWLIYERTLLRLLDKLPEFLLKLIRPFVKWWIKFLASYFMRKYSVLIAQRTLEACKVPKAENAMRQLYPGQSGAALLQSYIQFDIYGYSAKITKWFDYEHEWCVD